MFGCLPRLCMLTGRKAHFTKVCRFPAAPWHLWDAGSCFSGRAETHEVFMLIVAKLPTKDDRRRVMRSCQGAAVIATNWNPRSSRNQRPRAPEGRSAFKNIYNEALASGARRGALADTGVTALIPRRRLKPLLPDSSISHESQDAGLMNFAYSPRTRAAEEEMTRWNMCHSVGGHKDLSAWLHLHLEQRLCFCAFF